LLQADSVAERGENLNTYFTASLYTNVCCSLFERHKLLFSFLLTIKIQQHAGIIDAREWRFLLAGPPAGEQGCGQGHAQGTPLACSAKGGDVHP
jgi:dynein heavy chain